MYLTVRDTTLFIPGASRTESASRGYQRIHPRAGAVGVLAIVVLALSLSACGGGGEPSGQSGVIGQAIGMQKRGLLPALDTSSSVAGTDANGNGVRDDIDAFIASEHASASQSAALAQMAKAFQSALLVNVSQTSAVAAAATAINDAVGCIWSIYGSSNASHEVRQLEAYTVNTPPRLAAYDQFNEALNGQSLSLATVSVCE